MNSTYTIIQQISWISLTNDMQLLERGDCLKAITETPWRINHDLNGEFKALYLTFFFFSRNFKTKCQHIRFLFVVIT